MAGTYLEGTSKILSGVYTLIKAALSRVIMGSRGIVAYPFASNWGPTNTLTQVLYGSEFDRTFNATGTTLSAKLVSALAWKAQPQTVLAYRMATSAAAKGTVTLNDAEAAKSLELETLYPSDRAFIATVKDSATAGKVVQITEDGVLLVQAEAATLDELETQLNASDYVRVKSKGTLLPANIASSAFAGGNNGSSVTATEYSAFLTAVEADGRANAFSLDGTTDAAIQASTEAWVKRVRTEGLYITYATGGAAAWDSDGGSAANTKSLAINDRGIVNVGNGVDDYTAAEMAIFIAARIASIPLNRSVTDEVVDFVAVNKLLTPGQRATCKQAGTLVFTKEGNAVVIDEGVNTLTTPHANETVEMGKIRVNNALDQISKDLEAFGNEYKKSKSNTDAARQNYAATVETSYLRALQSMEVIQPGYFYRPDPQYHGKTAVYSPKIDEAFFYADITPVDSMERIYQQINLRF